MQDEDKDKTIFKNKIPKNIQYQGIFKAKKAGATHVRTSWDASGDDGCFEHQVLKNQVKVDFSEFEYELGKDMEEIIQNKFTLNEINNGMVCIVKLDLATGELITWVGEEIATVSDRFAEFLLNCEYKGIFKVNSILNLEEGGDGEVKKLFVDPGNKKRNFIEVLMKLTERLVYMEYNDDEKDLINVVRKKCGELVTLDIDVAGRRFEFSGNGKKVKVKVPKNHLGGEVSRLSPWPPAEVPAKSPGKRKK